MSKSEQTTEQSVGAWLRKNRKGYRICNKILCQVPADTFFAKTDSRDTTGSESSIQQVITRIDQHKIAGTTGIIGFVN